jgi:hypothetical protein
VGWNLLAGYTGQFSLAHHTFAGIGAYTSALLVQRTGIPILAGVVMGAVVAAAVGYGLGSLCLRMRAIYLALATWAFAESVRLLVTVEYQITRGDLGLAAPLLFGTPRATPYYYLFLGLALGALLVAWQIVHSRIGAYLRAIRDDEEAAATMGVDTFRWKRFAFVVSAVFAAVAGAFQGHYIGLLGRDPDGAVRRPGHRGDPALPGWPGRAAARGGRPHRGAAARAGPAPRSRPPGRLRRAQSDQIGSDRALALPEEAVGSEHQQGDQQQEPVEVLVGR